MFELSKLESIKKTHKLLLRVIRQNYIRIIIFVKISIKKYNLAVGIILVTSLVVKRFPIV